MFWTTKEQLDTHPKGKIGIQDFFASAIKSGQLYIKITKDTTDRTKHRFAFSAGTNTHSFPDSIQGHCVKIIFPDDIKKTIDADNTHKSGYRKKLAKSLCLFFHPDKFEVRVRGAELINAKEGESLEDFVKPCVTALSNIDGWFVYSEDDFNQAQTTGPFTQAQKTVDPDTIIFSIENDATDDNVVDSGLESDEETPLESFVLMQQVKLKPHRQKTTTTYIRFSEIDDTIDLFTTRPFLLLEMLNPSTQWWSALSTNDWRMLLGDNSKITPEETLLKIREKSITTPSFLHWLLSTDKSLPKNKSIFKQLLDTTNAYQQALDKGLDLEIAHNNLFELIDFISNLVPESIHSPRFDIKCKRRYENNRNELIQLFEKNVYFNNIHFGMAPNPSQVSYFCLLTSRTSSRSDQVATFIKNWQNELLSRTDESDSNQPSDYTSDLDVVFQHLLTSFLSLNDYFVAEFITWLRETCFIAVAIDQQQLFFNRKSYLKQSDSIDYISEACLDLFLLWHDFRKTSSSPSSSSDDSDVLSDSQLFYSQVDKKKFIDAWSKFSQSQIDDTCLVDMNRFKNECLRTEAAFIPFIEKSGLSLEDTPYHELFDHYLNYVQLFKPILNQNSSDDFETNYAQYLLLLRTLQENRHNPTTEHGSDDDLENAEAEAEYAKNILRSQYSLPEVTENKESYANAIEQIITAIINVQRTDALSKLLDFILKLSITHRTLLKVLLKQL